MTDKAYQPALLPDLMFEVNQPMRPIEKPEQAEQPEGHKPTMADRFKAFHLANPFVYGFMEKLAKEVYDEGLSRVSIQYLITSFRLYGLRTLGSEYKFPNNLGPYYARLLRARNKRFRVSGFIETRKLKRQADQDAWDRVLADLEGYAREIE